MITADDVAFARRVARAFAYRRGQEHNLDELESAALGGLLQAASSYQAERQRGFRSWAMRRIHGAMLDCLRDLDMVPRRLRASSETVDCQVIGGERGAKLLERLSSPAEADEFVALAEALAAIVALPPRERTVSLLVLQGFSLREIGARIGLSAARICCLQDEALRSVRMGPHQAPRAGPKRAPRP